MKKEIKELQQKVSKHLFSGSDESMTTEISNLEKDLQQEKDHLDLMRRQSLLVDLSTELQIQKALVSDIQIKLAEHPDVQNMTSEQVRAEQARVSATVTELKLKLASWTEKNAVLDQRTAIAQMKANLVKMQQQNQQKQEQLTNHLEEMKQQTRK